VAKDNLSIILTLYKTLEKEEDVGSRRRKIHMLLGKGGRTRTRARNEFHWSQIRELDIRIRKGYKEFMRYHYQRLFP
jgi:hypothetical protein